MGKDKIGLDKIRLHCIGQDRIEENRRGEKRKDINDLIIVLTGNETIIITSETLTCRRMARSLTNF